MKSPNLNWGQKLTSFGEQVAGFEVELIAMDRWTNSRADEGEEEEANVKKPKLYSKKTLPVEREREEKETNGKKSENLG